MFDRTLASDTPVAKVLRPSVRIHILGEMRALSYSGENILPRGKRARAILGSLCLSRGVPRRRSRLAAMLWDRVDDVQARASFRQAFRELVVAFGRFAGELIEADRETIRLKTDLCWIDASAFLAAEPQRLLKDDLVKEFEGELFEGLDDISASFDQWLIAERARFAEQRREQFEAQLSEAHREDSEVRERASIAQRVIDFDPTHEGASRTLMRAHFDSGVRVDALKEYGRLRKALRDTLDIEPSPETRALYEVIHAASGGDKNGEIAEALEREPVERPKAKRPKRPGVPQVSGRRRVRVGVIPFMEPTASSDSRIALWLSNDIASALQRFRWFDVVAPVSLMNGPKRTLGSDELLHRNELDYVVDGALTVHGDKIHFNVRLLDLTDYASPVWSDRFQLASNGGHGVDAEVISKIVSRIDPLILFIEGKSKRHDKYDATGLLMKAIPRIYDMDRSKYEEAGRLIKDALEMEPDNAMVAAWAAYWHLFYVGQGWAKNPARELASAQEQAVRAIKLDPDNAEALGIYAHILSFVNRDFDGALERFDHALRLNPNLAFNWAFSSGTYSYIGEPDIALQRLARYRELAPFDPYFFWFENFYTIAYMFKGDYRQAAIVGRRAVAANAEFSNAYKPLIAALGHLGRIEEAGPYVERLLQLEQNFTIKRFIELYPIKKDSDRDRYAEGLRRAGIPEG